MKLSHLVDAEYGNQGIDFKMVPREGFGWMNCTFLLCCRLSSRLLTRLLSAAAYQVGLSFLTSHMRRAVAACTSPEVFFSHANGSEVLAIRSGGMDPLGLAMDALDITSQ